MSTFLLPLLGLGCAPPAPVDLTAAEAIEPTIEVLFPTPGLEIELNENCELDTLIVVDIDGLDLIDPDEGAPPTEGQGHWHGGPSLVRGYCLSSETWCDDYQPETFPAPSNASVSVTLVTNNHQPFGDTVQVEIQLTAPPGVTCP